MQGKKLTQRESAIIQQALDKRNPSIFTNIFLRDRGGGKLVYPGSRRYETYLQHHKETGDQEFLVESSEVQFKVSPRKDEKTGALLFYEDRGFVLLKWALEFYRAEQKEKTVIGLTGTGKTLNVGAMALFMAAAYPYFKFVNLAPTARQSALMFKAIREFVDNTEYRDVFIKPGKQGIIESPHPQIRLNNESTLTFFNVEKDASNIQGEWGDWFNRDEAGLLNGYDETGMPIFNSIGVGIATRMRGERPDGKLRLGWNTVISMAYDCDPLWDRYEKAQVEPETYWSRLVLHSDNYYLTKENIDSIIRNTPPGLEGMWLRGERPPMMGAEFNPSILQGLYSVEQMEEAKSHVDEIDTEKRSIVQDSRFGVVIYEEPYDQGKLYLMAGDPGQDAPPNRNAPTIMVWDVTDFPHKKAKLAAFWWGFANGSIMPFVEKFAELMRKYRVPEHFRGFDSTATQKYMTELVWMSENESVIPMGFDGGKKYQYLNATKFLLSKGKLQIPAGISGIEQQIKRYRLPDHKIPQDIVAVLGMCCQLMFPLYINEYGEIDSFGMERAAQASQILTNYSRNARQAADRYARPATR